MSKSRRRFLTQISLGLIGATASHCSKAQQSNQLPPGAPPAFGTGPAAGPEVSPAVFAGAERLAQVELTPEERHVALEPTLAPWSLYESLLPDHEPRPQRGFIRSHVDPGPLPRHDEDLAFASLTQLSRWIEQRELTSERLTQLYLQRLRQFDSKLRCVITLTHELALTQAQRADAEIAAGKYRGPLHGIPWGAKDLLDTAGISTTYGAEPFRNRIPKVDAVVVKRLHDAGAVLVAKLSMGALALNDFGSAARR